MDKLEKINVIDLENSLAKLLSWTPSVPPPHPDHMEVIKTAQEALFNKMSSGQQPGINVTGPPLTNEELNHLSLVPNDEDDDENGGEKH